MPKRAVIDSGPLIALFDASDKYHKSAVAFIKEYRGQLYSTTAVITEVMYLLGFSVKAQVNFLQWVADGAIDLIEVEISDLYRIIEMTKKYSDLPMDFADGSLVAVCEKLKIKNVITLDSDFYVYRTKNKSDLKNLFPR